MQISPTLRTLANKYNCDKGDKALFRHNYTALYDLIFYPLRCRHIKLLELGLAIGGPEGGGLVERKVSAPSIAMWLEYFPHAEIYGFDISDFSHLDHPRFHFVRGDLGSRDDLLRLAQVASHFDVIIDDGSHASYHQQLALNYLFSRLSQGGIYIIEGLHWQPPLFENTLPNVPKTAQLLHDALIEDIQVGSAGLPAERLRAIRHDVHSFSLFPTFNDDKFSHKIALIRRAGTHREDDAHSLPEVRSYDLFDTLVTRRCYHPTHVFHEVERRSAKDGFAALRREAEASLYGTSYKLNDIYRKLSDAAGLTEIEVEQLRETEIEIEREMLFPIAENCAAFRPGDIVISDMYLPDHFLREVVRDVCHIDAAQVYVSAEGKRNGQIWPIVRRDFAPVQHIGDNEAADINSALAAGIPAKLTTVARRTQIESDLADGGYEPLSNLAREARLRSWSVGTSERQLQILQAQVNFPLLFVASLRLVDLAAEKGWRKILFSGRDCFLWSELYTILAPFLVSAPDGVYFHTSRIARANPSVDYLDYFAGLRGKTRAAVVDLCGTGWSLNRLIERAADSEVEIFLLHHLDVPSIRADYESHGPIDRPIAPISCIRRPILNGENEVIEELNRAPYPLLLDVVATSTGFQPVFAPKVVMPGADAALRIHHTAFRDALALLYSIEPAALAAMRSGNHDLMFARLYREMEGQVHNVSHFWRQKAHEEGLFRAAIEERDANRKDHDNPS